jgi:hypothetical protein
MYRAWATARVSDGHNLAVAEISDYEARRELLRKGAHVQVRRLDALIAQSEFLSIDRPTMLLAAQLWAQLRAGGQPRAQLSSSVECRAEPRAAGQGRSALSDESDGDDFSSSVGRSYCRRRGPGSIASPEEGLGGRPETH